MQRFFGVSIKIPDGVIEVEKDVFVFRISDVQFRIYYIYVMQRYYSKINYRRLLLLTLALTILAIASLFVNVVYEENGSGDEILYHVSNWIFVIVAYPGVILPKILSYQYYSLALILGGLIGVITNSLILELLIIRYSSYRLSKSKQSVN